MCLVLCAGKHVTSTSVKHGKSCKRVTSAKGGKTFNKRQALTRGVSQKMIDLPVLHDIVNEKLNIEVIHLPVAVPPILENITSANRICVGFRLRTWHNLEINRIVFTTRSCGLHYRRLLKCL